MNTLLLGGNGFIGSHVVDLLLEGGHRVKVFDRSMEKYRNPLPQVDYRLGSFSDTAALAEALEGVEIVYHLISTTVPSTSNLDPVGDIEMNLVNSVKLLQLMIQKGIPRIVYLSSGGTVYGIPRMIPIPETHPLHPICSYGVVKGAVERYIEMYHHLHGIEYIVLRASNPYGERQGHYGVQGVIGTFLEKVRRGEKIEIWGNGGIVRDFFYVRDLARLCVQAGYQKDALGIYNAGSGVGKSIREVLDVIERTVGRKLIVSHKDVRSFDVPEIILDVAKARETFTWRPEVDLAEGIRKTWLWMKSK